MGQQQLLLLVLGIVITGLAVVVGLQAFAENQKKANADALVDDALAIAADAQIWILKPPIFGGGDGAFTDITFEKMGYTPGDRPGGDVATATGYETPNAVYTLTVDSATQITVVGCNTALQNTVTSVVGLRGPDAIVTAVSPGGCS